MPRINESNVTAAAATPPIRSIRHISMSPESRSPSICTPREATPAVRRVLESTAFLQRILATVPVRTLLISQRVNKSFRDAIGHSPVLQQRLWFAEVTDLSVSAPHGFNPLLRMQGGKEWWAAHRGPAGESFRPFENVWQSKKTAPYSYTATLHAPVLCREHGQSWQGMIIAHTVESEYTLDLITNWGYMAGFQGTNDTKMHHLVQWVRNHKYYKEARTHDNVTLKPTGLRTRARNQVRKGRSQLLLAWVYIFGRREETRI